MRLSRLKRLLGRKRPELVRPSVIVRAHPTEEGWESPVDEAFLWGSWQVTARRPLIPLMQVRGTNGISDGGTHLYKMIYQPRNGGGRSNVTYDPVASRQALVAIIRDGHIANQGNYDNIQ